MFADFVHTFPRGWRAAILEEYHDCAGLKDGALALLGSIMEHDCSRIILSGDSIISIYEDIPKDNIYDPSCFNLLPNILMKDLISANCGVSLSAKTPAAWRGHCWTGRGTLQQAVIDDAVARLNLGRSLPSPDLLAKDYV